MLTMLLEENAAVGASDFTEIISSFTSNFSPATLLGIIAVGLGACAGFVLAWIGVKKLVPMIQSAIKNGKLKV